MLVTAGLPNHDALELIRLGIFGIFHKQQAPDELLRTIHGVAEGKVLRLLLEGLSNKEIAAQIGVSEGAIKAALQQLFAKTGVRTRSHLVRVALEKLRDDL